MKKILFSILTLLMSYVTYSQCSMRMVNLNDRTNASDLIIEGKVTGKNSFWNASHNMIYTSNVIEVYKVFKGNLTASSIEILTMGGTVGMDRIIADPSLKLSVGDIGVFTCENVKRFDVPFSNRTSFPQFEAYASTQGFIKYDLVSETASEPFKRYTNIESEVYNTILSAGWKNWKVIKPFDIHTANASQKNGQPLQVQSISGFSPTSITAGTGNFITITGSSFGATQGSGVVRFKNGDDGGATYITPLPSQYISWSSTQIVVEVPQNAGTGNIQVIQGATQTSAGILTINYAHLNVDFDPGSGTTAYQTDHVNDNGSGGYTWRMNTGFSSNSAASASFMRAFDTWRCNTGVNWTIGSTTSINDAVSDGTNIICFDNAAPLSAGILGVCYSYWSGCASGPTIVWYVNELDIIFDEGSNITPLTWEYGTATPSGSEYDFETVAVHELGHGHQLGHVINPGAIMHYAISNGTSNRSLGTGDLNGGNFVQGKSTVANVCGPGAMSNHSCGTAPVASFSASPTSICPGATVNFTDLTSNTPTSWAWTFTGGTPSTSASQNPSVTYNTPGTYAVQLIATNSTGSNTIIASSYIVVNAIPSVSINAGSSSICSGSSTALTASGASTYVWNTGATTSSISVSPVANTTYTVTGTNSSGCSNTDVITITVNALPNVTANASPSSICSGSSSTLTSNGAMSYLWNTGATTPSISVSPVANTTYTVTGTNSFGCSNTDVITITVNALPNVTANASPSSICSGSSSTLTCSGAMSYLWSTGQATTLISVSPVANTVYSVTGTNGLGCSNSATVGVNVVNCSGATQLTPASCGSTLTSLDQYVYFNTVTGATNYKLEIINDQQPFSTINVRNQGNSNDFKMSWIPGIQYGRTYKIRVSVYVNGVWSAWGAMCTLTTPSIIPTTQFSPGSCGITLSSLDQTLNFNPVSGATNYRIEMTNSTQPFNVVNVRNNNLTTFKLSWVTGIQYNRTYNMRISAYVSGSWQPYGSVCSITTPPTIPTTQLNSSSCGMTVSALNEVFNWNPVSGATKYKVEIINTAQPFNVVNIRTNNLTSFALSYVSGTTTGRTYDIRVAPYVNGIWGNYGTMCQVTAASSGMISETTPDEAASRMISQSLSEDGEVLVNIYPNPSNGVFTIDLSAEHEVEISNILGEEIMKHLLPEGRNQIYMNDQTNGIYFVKIKSGDKQQVFKIIKEN